MQAASLHGVLNSKCFLGGINFGFLRTIHARILISLMRCKRRKRWMVERKNAAEERAKKISFIFHQVLILRNRET